MLTKDLETIFNNFVIFDQFTKCKELFTNRYEDEASYAEYKREIKKLKIMVSERK